MRASFDSNHVTGDYSGGRLVIRVTIEDDERQFTCHEEIFFSVPPDFHAHNDLVAAALIAAIGAPVTVARFNFPISERCATILARHYRLDDVSPVDPDLEPRRPGRHYGVSFSGGLDSLAMLTLLRDSAGIDVKVITGEYEGFHREAVGYASYERDVSCWTNHRRVFGHVRRFDAVVPLLFADYADLHTFVSGHDFGSGARVWVDPRSDASLNVPRRHPVSEAGGLKEAHIARCLHTNGLLKFLVMAASERIATGLHVTSRPGTQKYLAKLMMLRHVYQETGQPLPPFLATIPRERHREGMPLERLIYLWTVWEWRALDGDTALRVEPRIGKVDWSPLEPFPLDFFWKYCPLTARLIPDDIRELVLAALRSAGVEPNDDQDYEELEQVRQFILAVNPPGSVT